MKPRNLTELPSNHQRMSWDTRVKRRIAPNEVLWFENVIVVEVKQSLNGDDYAVNCNAIDYAAEQERVPGVQGYVRLLKRDSAFASQITITAYKSKVRGITPRESAKEGFGPYIWVDEHFNSVNNGSHAPSYADDPPWVKETA